jgi:hypothetical protein
MEIWSEHVRLQDARVRAESLRRAFEPVRLERQPSERTPRRRRRHSVTRHRHVLAH